MVVFLTLRLVQASLVRGRKAKIECCNENSVPVGLTSFFFFMDKIF